MRAIAESIKRLYQSGKLTKAQVLERKNKDTITSEEYLEIVGEEA